jgi:hypothetical protein
VPRASLQLPTQDIVLVFYFFVCRDFCRNGENYSHKMAYNVAFYKLSGGG